MVAQVESPLEEVVQVGDWLVCSWGELFILSRTGNPSRPRCQSIRHIGNKDTGGLEDILTLSRPCLVAPVCVDQVGGSLHQLWPELHERPPRLVPLPFLTCFLLSGESSLPRPPGEGTVFSEPPIKHDSWVETSPPPPGSCCPSTLCSVCMATPEGPGSPGTAPGASSVPVSQLRW